MQSIFRLPWSAETSVDRAGVDTLAFPKSRHPPIVEIPFINKGKRKVPELGSSPTSLAAAFDARPLKKAKVSSTPPVATMRTPTMAAIGPVYASPRSQSARDVPSAAPSPSPNPAHRSIQPTPPRTESSCASNGNASDSSSPVPTIEPTRLAPAAPIDPQPRGVNLDQLTRAQCVIQAQFDMEIMMKHEELRRIDQELAKCQIALEQLRRCRIIPYPGIKGFSEAVTDGKGPALAPPAGHTKPSLPSPWGVTDGPYSRHYAAWLLKDPSFDPYPVQYVQQNAREADRRSASDGRTTRGSGGDVSSTGFSRTSRTSSGSKSFGAGDQTPSAPPKDPLVFRRQADGKLVRLSCNKCLKDQFANVQGFINHYRIQHHYGFRSHEAAAIACGKVIDESEAPTPGAPAPAAAVAAATPKEAAPKPIVAAGAADALVHPLINSVPTRPPMPALVQDVLDGLRADPRRFAEQTGRTSASFTPASQTPRLSRVLQNRGFSGDLSKFVADATVKYEDSTSYEPSEDEAEAGAEVTPNPSKVKRVPPKLNPSKGSKKRGGMSPATGRTVGYSADKKRKLGPLSPSLASPPTFPSRDAGLESPVRDEADLSPNTVESNPGLVSDYEDDDDEDYNAFSHAQTDEEEADIMDVDIEDHSDIDRGNGLNRIGRHRAPAARK